MKMMTTLSVAAYQRRQPSSSALQRGFTLIEMIMVIVLLSVVMGIVGGKVYDNFTKGKYDAGRIGVRKLSGDIEHYSVDNGVLPSNLDDLVTRPGNAANWSGPYAKPSDLNDPFGHRYVYKMPGDHGDFDLIFLGKDGAVGGDAINKDFGNWE
jgi:general secretion pathway protein G